MGFPEHIDTILNLTRNHQAELPVVTVLSLIKTNRSYKLTQYLAHEIC